MTVPDMAASIVPRSDQINADDILCGPITVTITDVTRGTAEQPVNVDLAEFPGRAYRPSKTVRRILVAAWGPDASTYAGRRMTLYRDPDVTFGREKVGGIRISHLSHIDKRLEIALTVTRGRRAMFTVEPLVDNAPAPISDEDAADFARDIAEASTPEQLEKLATDLKQCNLGTHRKPLLEAFAARKETLTSDGA